MTNKIVDKVNHDSNLNAGVLPFLFQPGGNSLFGPSILDKMSNVWNNSAQTLMNNYKKEDGSTVLEYNLAGFSKENVSVKVDTAAHELIINALIDTEETKRKFSTIVELSPYTSPDDITTTLENGVLQIVIAPLEKRKQESLVDIQIT